MTPELADEKLLRRAMKEAMSRKCVVCGKDHEPGCCGNLFWHYVDNASRRDPEPWEPRPLQRLKWGFQILNAAYDDRIKVS